MSTQHTGAFGALAFLVTLVLVIFLPGLLLGALLRLRGLALWGLAAPFGVSVISVGGVVAAEAHVGWRTPTFLAWTLLCLAAAALVGLLCRRWTASSRSDGRRVQLGALAGGLVAAATVAVSFRLAVGSVRSVPAQPDAAYHLNQIRNMLTTHNISSLHAAGLLNNGHGGLYPAAWHGISVTALQIAPIELPIASNLLAVIAGALIWTSGCLLLARQAFGARGATLAMAGVLSAGFTAMPYLLTGYGVLWPNLLGMALVPALLAGVVSVAGLARDDVLGRPMAIVALVIGFPGLFFAHPNGVAALVLLSFAILLLEAPRWSYRHRRSHPAVAVLILLALASVPFIWWGVVQIPKVHNLTRFYNHPPDESVRRAVTEAFLNNPRYGAPLWIVGGLALIGLVQAIRSRRDQWQVAVWAVAWLVFIGVAAYQDGISRAVTGVWYNNSPRLAAITPIGSFLLATGGMVAVSHWLHRLAEKRNLSRNPLLPLTISAALIAVYFVGTGGNYVREHADRVHPYFHPYKSHNALLTSAGYTALQALGPTLPKNALVANNPWRGGSLLYAIGDRAVLFDSEKAVNSPDRNVIARELFRATLPGRGDICAAVRRVGIDYVITGGSNFLPDHQGITHFPGIDKVAGAPGFVQVATHKPYTLWKITACGS